MKYPLLFWSRKTHCWAGVYLSLFTVLWLGEMLILPAVYNPEMESASSSAASTAPKGGEVLSLQDVLERFGCERVEEQPLTLSEATFLPQEGAWVLRDAGRYISVTYDARTGAVRDRAFDSSKFVEEKGGLGWLSSEWATVLRYSFPPLFVLLCVTGIYLLLWRKRPL